MAFAERHPQIRIELLIGDQRLDLASHQIDIALRATDGGLPDMGYSARSLTRLTMGWYAAPDYLIRAGIPTRPEDLPQHALVLMAGPHGCTVTLQQNAQQERLTLWPRLQTQDYASVLRLTLAGGGIGYFPELVAASSLQRGLLQPVLTDWTTSAGELFLITQSGLRVPARVQAFKQFLLERLTPQ